MPSESRPAALLEGRTAWGRNVETPLRDFPRTETGSAAVLLGATLAALAWVSIDTASYEAVWRTTLSIRLGGAGIAQDLRHWVNSVWTACAHSCSTVVVIDEVVVELPEVPVAVRVVVTGVHHDLAAQRLGRNGAVLAERDGDDHDLAVARDHDDLLARGVDADPEILRFAGVPPMFSLRDPDGNLLYVVELMEQAA